MKREPCFGKNVSLKAGNIEIITSFMNKTKKGFSGTLNIIIQQWDEFSITIMRLQQDQETQKGIDHFDKIDKAKPIKRVKTDKSLEVTFGSPNGYYYRGGNIK